MKKFQSCLNCFLFITTSYIFLFSVKYLYTKSINASFFDDVTTKLPNASMPELILRVTFKDMKIYNNETSNPYWYLIK